MMMMKDNTFRHISYRLSMKAQLYMWNGAL